MAYRGKMAGLRSPTAGCGRPRLGRAAVAAALPGTEGLGGGAADESERTIRVACRLVGRHLPPDQPPEALIPTLNRHIDINNILVVDDDRDTAETMAQWLKHFGHEVHIARDGYQAIE